MDNNNQQTVLINDAQQQSFAQAPQGQPQMNQQMYTQYGQQPQMNAQYGQPQMNQQMYTQYGQQPQMYNQQMGYTQYGYQQPQMPKQPSKLKENVKDVQNQFKNKVSKMGLSTFCLVGIIAAMFLIFGPFMNFASLHINEEYDDEFEVRVKASDGLNLFELSKLSNTLDRVIDEANDEFRTKVDKDDIVDLIEDYEDYLVDEVEDEVDMDVENLAKETVGTLILVTRGQLALMLTPWLVIISGLGLLVFTVINNKKAKIICSIVPIACIIWLMICSSNFFAMMGIGAWVILLGSIGGIVSAVKDAPTLA